MCTFVAGFKTRASTEVVRERVIFQRNRGEDRIFHLKTVLKQRVRKVLISKRIALYGCIFVAGFKTRASTEVVRERVKLQRNRGEDRSQQKIM